MPDENAATFTSSVPMLDKVWELVRHSALYVSQEQFVDTPTREKGQFLADSFNDSQATMHAFGEQNLTWQALAGLRAVAGALLPRRQPQRRVPERRRAAGRVLDFTERYPEWVWQYYLETGDRATLAAAVPGAASA